jgi:hypothetical protein
MALPELVRAVFDPTAPLPPGWPAGAGGVLLLFCIPIGGGIPAGVLMAKSFGIAWPEMLGLYFVSDLILAVVFEPLMLVGGALLRRSAFGRRFAEAWRLSMRRTTERFGRASGPLALVLVAFGLDPMSGRTAAAAAGHGFFPGWAIAIAGDMLYFSVLMVSTLWLGSVLGDGTSTVAVVFVLMMVLPQLLQRRAAQGAR